MKTYDIIDLLESQHAEVGVLFDKLETADAGDRVALFFDLVDNLAMQASIEETMIFPLIADYGITRLVLESVRAHAAIKSSLADMLALDPHVDAAEFDALLYLLRCQVEDHVRDDEKRALFPALRRLLSDEQRHALATYAAPMFGAQPLAA